ncbi:MAG: hypothetical protein HY257_08945 [Chloroflexi bacterium]|nr:hypothetical protein [Chloroflexota bacterium]
MELNFAGDESVARDAAFIARIRAQLELAADVELKFAAINREADETRALLYDLILPVVVHGSEFGAADGVYVDEVARAELRFDARGALLQAAIQIQDEKHLHLVKDQIKKLAAQNAIYDASASAIPESEALVEMKKNWIVALDAQNRKRLKRAFMTYHFDRG